MPSLVENDPVVFGEEVKNVKGLQIDRRRQKVIRKAPLAQVS